MNNGLAMRRVTGIDLKSTLQSGGKKKQNKIYRTIPLV